jgi:hypothetical protein
MSVLQRMLDIPVESARGSDLFLYGKTNDPRGQHMLTMVGSTIPQHWEVRQIVPGINQEASASSSGATEVGVEQLTHALTKWIDKCEENRLSIAIDISCMSRPTMAAALQAVLDAATRRHVTLRILYVIAEYSPPPLKLPPNEDIRPVNDWFAGWPTNATASTSLVVGLGYERDKASGACEYFDASETWVFVPQSAISKYEAAVVDNNRELLNRARRRDRVINYAVERPTETFGVLAAAVSRILPRMNPVLLPFGPKIFFALSLLVAAVYREAGVWHVTGDSDLPEVPHAPSAYTSAFEVELGPSVSPNT